MPGTSMKLFQIFDCFNFDPNNDSGTGEKAIFLRVDMEVDCTSSRYQFGRLWVYFMIAVYPIGHPLVYFLLLYNNREEIKQKGIKNREHIFLDTLGEMTEEERAKYMMVKRT